MNKLFEQFIYFILLSCTFSLGKCAVKAPQPILDIPLGRIEGSVRQSIDGRDFYAFEGIPYAKPPVGKYRFAEPQAVEPWTYVLKANTIHKCLHYNHSVYQYNADLITGQEDCLYLNIYTPVLNRKAKLDVIFYIHGGAFMFNYGGGNGPQMLLNKDIVFVNMNYRLGPLGFLSTEDDVLPGNNGLKDQQKALHWIIQYIEYFGGNPESITIAGNSAGGASVHLHYLIPSSKGLFHKGISQSGCALNPWVMMEAPLEKTKKIAALVGCPTNFTVDMVDCLKRRSGRQIVGTVKEFQDDLPLICGVLQPWLYNPFSPFGVVVDHWATHPLLPDHPYNLLKNKKVYDVPWIISHTNSEGSYPAADFYTDDDHFKQLEERWNDLMPHILDYNFTVDAKFRDSVSQKIRKFYLNDKTVSRETFPEIIQMVGDRIFVVDIQKSAHLHASAVASPVRMYYFTYRGTRGMSERRAKSPKNFGAAHTEDLSFVVSMNVDRHTVENDRTISDLLVKIWTSFAHTGKPNLPIDWPAVSRKNLDDIGNLTVLTIGKPNDYVVGYNGELGHKTFWKSLPIMENEKLFIVKDEL